VCLARLRTEVLLPEEGGERTWKLVELQGERRKRFVLIWRKNGRRKTPATMLSGIPLEGGGGL
jgi:hypothetical protein